MTTLYWQVYKNLEKEFLQLSEIIHINDAQLGVYSMKIADLLIRTVIEIEALAKDLYLSNGGPSMADEDMYFDTVCMKYLNDLWQLDSKVVYVTSPNVYLENEENKILRPLHKSMKRGSSSSDWNKAYQAVKHNRVKELSKGNLKHLLHGLAALYVLNLYYRDEQVKNLTDATKGSVNGSFGSELFAVKIHKTQGLKATGEYEKSKDYDECVYLEDYEPNSKKVATEAIKEMDDYVGKAMIAELERMMKEKAEKGEIPTQEWVDQQRTYALRNVLPVKDYKLAKRFNDGLNGIRYIVVLNKNQYADKIQE